MASKTQPGGLESSIPCNLCGSKAVGLLSLKDRKGAYLRTVICKNCGLIWSDPRPDHKKIKDYYAKTYRKEYKGIKRPKKKHLYRNAKESTGRYLFIKDFIREGDRLLDIGAGNGVFVYCLRRLGYDAQGIEPDESHSQYAREILHVPVTTTSSEDFNAQAAYDMVTLYHVLEHMTDPFAELRRIRTMLKQEGKLAVEVPNGEDTQQDPKNRYHKAHIYTFNPETLIALVEKAGFAIIKKKIAPLNGNISLVLQKSSDILGPSVGLSNNHLKIISILNRHTNYTHFSSIVPYKKFTKRLLAAIKEQMAFSAFSGDKDIINKVITDELGAGTKVKSHRG